MRAEISKGRLKSAQIIIGIALLFVAATTASLAQSTDTKPIQIERGTLENSLLEVGRIFDVEVLFSGDLVSEQIAPPIDGTYSAEAALRSLLAGSNLKAEKDGSAYLIVRDEKTSTSADVSEQLDETAPIEAVVVKGIRTGSFPAGISKSGNLGILGDRDILDTPLSVKSFDETFIEDRVSLRLNDLLSYDASFNPQTNPLTDSRSNGYLRGFFTSQNRGGLNGYYPISLREPPAEMVERIDVLKGAATLFMGARQFGGTGGAINLQTKRPLAEDSVQLSGVWGSGSNLGGHLDLTERFGENDNFGVRVNVVRRSGDVAVEGVSEEIDLAHVNFTYDGDRFQSRLEYANWRFRVSGANQDIRFAAGVDVPDIETSEGYGADYAFQEDEFHLFQGEVTYKITPEIEVFGAYGYQENEGILILNQPTLLNNDGDVETRFGARDSFGDQYSVDVGARAEFDVGSVTNRISVGYTYWELGFGFNGRLSINDAYPDLNLNLNRPNELRSLPLPDSVPPLLLSTDPVTPANELDGYFLINEFSMMDDRVNVIAGARYVEFNDLLQDTGSGGWSPGGGVVFQPTGNSSLYVSYLEAIERGATSPDFAANPNFTLDPGASEAIEAGYKIDLGSWGVTVAAFSIDRPSAGLDPDTNIFEEVGQNQHQGFEANIFGEIRSGFRIYGSFTYLDAEIRRAVDTTLEGNTPQGVPELIAVAGFDIDISSVRGLGVTGNVRYTDEMFIDNANTTTIPSFTTADLGVRYGFFIGDKPVLARLSAYNVFDNDHFVSGRNRSAVVGSPFAVRGSFTVEF